MAQDGILNVNFTATDNRQLTIYSTAASWGVGYACRWKLVGRAAGVSRDKSINVGFAHPTNKFDWSPYPTIVMEEYDDYNSPFSRLLSGTCASYGCYNYNQLPTRNSPGDILEIRRIGSVAKFYRNDVYVTTNDYNVPTDELRGVITAGGWPDGTIWARFDYYLIRKIIEPEPVVTIEQ